MAKFETIYDQIGPELEEVARLNKGQVAKKLFEQLIGENFGCNQRTIDSYTKVFRTFGVIRPLNKSWYQFKAWSSGEDDEREPPHQVVNA